MKDFVVVVEAKDFDAEKDDVVEKNDVVETLVVDKTRYSAGAVDEVNCFVDEASEFAVDCERVPSDSPEDASYKMRGQTQTEAFHDSVLERCHRPSLSSSGDRPSRALTN